MKSLKTIASILAFSLAAKAETFRVALPVIVPFNPISNEVNSNVYVGLQLYYPLFSMEDEGNLSSKFLDISKSKSLDLSFNRYQLCLLPGLKFSDGSPITQKDFITSLSTMSKLYPHIVQMEKIEPVSSNCIQLILKQKTPYLFKKLTGMASTILKAAEVDKVYPIGFGPYRIARTDADLISLEFTDGTKPPRFDKVEFRKVASDKDLLANSFHDLNQLTGPLRGKATTQNVYSINIPASKVYTLVLNLPDYAARSCAAKLLSKGNWNSVYELKAEPQKSFLPWKREVPEQKFEKIRCSKVQAPIDFLVADAYDSNAVVSEIRKIGAEGIFRVHPFPSADFVKWVFSGKPYVAMISFDSSSAIASLDGDFTDYFESFFSTKNRILTVAPKGLAALITKSNQFSTSSSDKNVATQDAETLLLKQFYVLPFGRLNRRLEFTNDIKIKEWADRLNGFPAVEKIE